MIGLRLANYVDLCNRLSLLTICNIINPRSDATDLENLLTWPRFSLSLFRFSISLSFYYLFRYLPRSISLISLFFFHSHAQIQSFYLSLLCRNLETELKIRSSRISQFEKLFFFQFIVSRSNTFSITIPFQLSIWIHTHVHTIKGKRDNHLSSNCAQNLCDIRSAN